MNNKVFCHLGPLSIDGGTSAAVSCTAIVYDSEGALVDNPWGVEYGSYQSQASVPYMATTAAMQASFEAEVAVAYAIEGEIEFIWVV